MRFLDREFEFAKRYEFNREVKTLDYIKSYLCSAIILLL